VVHRGLHQGHRAAPIVSGERPEVPIALTEAVLRAASTSTASVFLPWVVDRVELQWSEGDEVNLGLTRFLASEVDLVRARRLRLDPGPILIELHPDLNDDEALFHHVYAHEMLHAAGLTMHSEEHDRLTNEVAPSPSMGDSPLLQRLRDRLLAQQPVQSWTCGHCGHTWQRTTMRTPTRCLRCARPLREA